MRIFMRRELRGNGEDYLSCSQSKARSSHAFTQSLTILPTEDQNYNLSISIGPHVLFFPNVPCTLATFLLRNKPRIIQGEDRKKWPPMKIGFLDYNCVKRAENVEKFINRTVQLPNMTEGLTLLNLKCNFHHTNR